MQFEIFFTKILQNPQNLVKTSMNLLKNLHLMNFRLFHVLKSIQYYLKNDNYKKNMSNFLYIMSKKGDFEIPKVINPDFSTKSISTVFSIIRFPGCTKTVLSGESLYNQQQQQYIFNPIMVARLFFEIMIRITSFVNSYL